MTLPRLTLEKIAVRFGGLIAVRDLSLSLAPGEIRGLIGPNGAGKTTAVNAISGVVPIEQGRILLDGDDVSGLAPPRSQPKRDCAYVSTCRSLW